MDPALLPALAAFAFATVMSPGPNNLMLMASGVNYGLRRSLPHMAGVAFGFPLMILPVGLGIMQLFDLWPASYTILKAASLAYLLWLAWRIAHAAPPGRTPQAASGRPLTFLEAVAFQWVNPKAWSMALGAVTLYAADRSLAGVATVAFTYALIGCLSTSTWTLLGQGMRRFLSDPARLRLFNLTMAVLLVASLIPALVS